jgi:hypothetical protein
MVFFVFVVIVKISRIESRHTVPFGAGLTSGDGARRLPH